MLFAMKEKGQGLVEYAIILALIAIVVIAVIGTLGNKVNNTFDLGTSKTVQRIVIYGLLNTPITVYQPSAIQIEYSDDNSSWTTELNKTGLSTGSGVANWIFDYTLGTSKTHRYWRVTTTQLLAGYVFLSEIEIFGS